MKLIVTGGAGFIGSNFVLQWLSQGASPVINLDALTYAGNPLNLSDVPRDTKYNFTRGAPRGQPIS